MVNERPVLLPGGRGVYLVPGGVLSPGGILSPGGVLSPGGYLVPEWVVCLGGGGVCLGGSAQGGCT